MVTEKLSNMKQVMKYPNDFLILTMVTKLSKKLPGHKPKPRNTSTFGTYSCKKEMTPGEINIKWKQLQDRIAEDFDTDKPDIKVMLFLIGVQELGQGPKKFSKRQKEELMHIANCRLFSELGFYELEGTDQDGWPHWKRVKALPGYPLLEQELLLKSLIVTYFEELYLQNNP